MLYWLKRIELFVLFWLLNTNTDAAFAYTVTNSVSAEVSASVSACEKERLNISEKKFCRPCISSVCKSQRYENRHRNLRCSFLASCCYRLELIFQQSHLYDTFHPMSALRCHAMMNPYTYTV